MVNGMKTNKKIAIAGYLIGAMLASYGLAGITLNSYAISGLTVITVSSLHILNQTS